ncbi:hypothetical protein Tco_0285897 [Tanacetum coccineum]
MPGSQTNRSAWGVGKISKVLRGGLGALFSWSEEIEPYGEREFTDASIIGEEEINSKPSPSARRTERDNGSAVGLKNPDSDRFSPKLNSLCKMTAFFTVVFHRFLLEGNGIGPFGALTIQHRSGDFDFRDWTCTIEVGNGVTLEEIPP